MGVFDFSGKTAVVTGAARGIGKEIALQLADCGADVWIADVLEDVTKQAAEEVAGKGVKTGYSITDVSDLASVEKMLDEATAFAPSGQIDILVHCAGIIVSGSLFDATPEQVRRITDVNVMGMFNVLTYGTKRMVKNNGGGRVVLIDSVAGRHGFRVQGHYNATKAAGLNYAQSVAVEVARFGVNVNAVCPGIIRTQMWDRILEDAEKNLGVTQDEEWNKYMEEIPQGRAQTVEDVAGAVLFFCSELSSAVTGQALNVDGGRYLN
ncbi:MAG: SDR family oxidoreductase [Clostridiales Family XIII bacterium]|jgi:meso-butanediol dehydrogenase/(S,S)-butanediol dehydrogenase/diacetyl reductase|nr:SDR family oxidoreductase [Clostridiales Family XIII bacterium]